MKRLIFLIPFICLLASCGSAINHPFLSTNFEELSVKHMKIAILSSETISIERTLAAVENKDYSDKDTSLKRPARARQYTLANKGINSLVKILPYGKRMISINL